MSLDQNSFRQTLYLDALIISTKKKRKLRKSLIPKDIVIAVLNTSWADQITE